MKDGNCVRGATRSNLRGVVVHKRKQGAAADTRVRLALRAARLPQEPNDTSTVDVDQAAVAVAALVHKHARRPLNRAVVVHFVAQTHGAVRARRGRGGVRKRDTLDRREELDRGLVDGVNQNGVKRAVRKGQAAVVRVRDAAAVAGCVVLIPHVCHNGSAGKLHQDCLILPHKRSLAVRARLVVVQVLGAGADPHAVVRVVSVVSNEGKLAGVGSHPKLDTRTSARSNRGRVRRCVDSNRGRPVHSVSRVNLVVHVRMRTRGANVVRKDKSLLHGAPHGHRLHRTLHDDIQGRPRLALVVAVL
eukprot:Rhum_TRINITY_DN15350_c0_g1::Rhum_TRINITY_DN15350_c0_g1_i1::g.152103::m.152103